MKYKYKVGDKVIGRSFNCCGERLYSTGTIVEIIPGSSSNQDYLVQHDHQEEHFHEGSISIKHYPTKSCYWYREDELAIDPGSWKFTDYMTPLDENDDKPVDPKASQAAKKLCFDSIPITLEVLASPANQSGADKYGTWNWLALEDGTMSIMTYINALKRHLILFRAGQDYTSDTNIHNLDAMIAGLAVVRDAMIFGKVKDDRVKLSEEQIKTLEDLLNKVTHG